MISYDTVIGGGIVATVNVVVGLFFKYRDKWRVDRSADEESTIERLKKENARAAERADAAEADADHWKQQRDSEVAKIRGDRDWMSDCRAAYRSLLIEHGLAEEADKILNGLQRQREIDQSTPKTIRARRDDDG